MSLGARRRRPPTPRFVANELWRRAGEVPSFHIAPARTRNATDLITGNLLGTYNSASPAWAVGPDGVLFQPAANAPVIEYDPVTLQCLGARIWGVVTNQVITSEDFSAWGRGGILAFGSGSLLNAILGPSGTLTADKIVENTSSGNHLVGRPSTITATSQTVTVSIFAKKAERSIIYLQGGSATNWAAGTPSAYFDLNAGTAYSSSGVTAVGILAFPNGWYRCFFSATTAASGVLNPDLNVYLVSSGTTLSYVGDGTSGLYLWGAQINPGPLSPYVPTTTTAASSTADVWSITGADFTRIFNNASGTIYAQAQNNTSQNFSGTFRHIAQATPATNIDSSVGVFINSSNQYQLQVRDNAVNQAGFNTGTNSGDVSKVAAAYAASDFAISANGGSPGTQASGSAPTTTIISQIVIGGVRDGNPLGALNGYIREFAIFRSRRPNANLQAMTL